MKFLSVFFVILMLSTSSYAEDKYDLEDLKQSVAKYYNSENSLELKNGRTYVLEKGIVIETFDMDNFPLKRNLFDLENGVLVHDTGETELSTECLEMITPFKDLPKNRIEEVTQIGCLIYARKRRLVTHHDDLADFNKKFCQVVEE